MSETPVFPKRGPRLPGRSTLPGFITLVFMFIALSWTVYSSFRIDIGEGEMAILIKKVGKDLTNGEEVAPSEEYKGVQKKVRPARNPAAPTGGPCRPARRLPSPPAMLG